MSQSSNVLGIITVIFLPVNRRIFLKLQAAALNTTMFSEETNKINNTHRLEFSIYT